MSDVDSGDENWRPRPNTRSHSREMSIVNRKGLHARATAKFVQCVDRFEADINVTRCGETVGGDSIMGILTLGAGMGSTITVSASGADARAGPGRARGPHRQSLRRGRMTQARYIRKSSPR